MSLDVYLKDPTATYDVELLYESNITHNLSTMASKAGVYAACWHPKTINAKHAKDIIKLLESGLERLKKDPKQFEMFNAPNGWGIYEDFVKFISNYLNACRKYPKAIIETSV